MFFQKFVIIEALVTSLASVLVVSSMSALMMTQTLRCGKVFSTLVTNKSFLICVSSLVNILQMTRDKGFRALRTGKFLLIIMLGGYVFQ